MASRLEFAVVLSAGLLAGWLFVVILRLVCRLGCSLIEEVGYWLASGRLFVYRLA